MTKQLPVLHTYPLTKYRLVDVMVLNLEQHFSEGHISTYATVAEYYPFISLPPEMVDSWGEYYEPTQPRRGRVRIESDQHKKIVENDFKVKVIEDHVEWE